MSTKYPDFFKKLAAPFHPNEVKSRQAPGGRQLAYITARTAMNRLDEVAGPENWWDEFEVARDNSMLCKLTVRLPDGSTVTKQGVGVTAGNVGEDAEKGGESDALKRAAAKFGVARYLYRDGVPDFAADAEHPQDYQEGPQRGQWGAPGSGPANPQPVRQPPHQGHGNGGGHHDGPPRSGKGLFAWCKQQEERLGPGLIKDLNGWAKREGLPGRMVDWEPDQVAEAHAEAVRLIEGVREPGED